MLKILLSLKIVFATFIVVSQTTVVKNLGPSYIGETPRSSLYFDGTFLYGTTDLGGMYYSGTLFKVKPDGTDFSVLHEFNSAQGITPRCAPIMNGIYLYGTAIAGGTFGGGVIYRIGTDGSGFTVIHHFSGGIGGSKPIGNLISESGYFYGTTYDDGPYNLGIIYRIKTDGTGFQILQNFSGISTGSSPLSGLKFDSGFLYGTTSAGGISDHGVIFKIDTAGNDFLKLHDFSGTDGQQSMAGLVFDGIYLYGNCRYGGTSNWGTLFRIKPDGTDFNILFSFNESTGCHPQGDLLLDGAVLYGTAVDEGDSLGGTVFKINIDGGGFEKLKDFSWMSDLGTDPMAGVITDGNFLYGTCSVGGANFVGTVYKICMYHPTAVATASPPWICEGGALTLTGSGAQDYTWTHGAINGVPFYPAGTNYYTLTATDSLGCAGTAGVTVFVYPCVGIEETDKLDVVVSPNPSNGSVRVSTGILNTRIKVRVFDEAMRVVYFDENVDSDEAGSVNLILTHLEEGIYFLEIFNEEEQFVVKVIIV